METLATRLKAMRRRRVLTQGELAQAAGVGVMTVVRLENATVLDPLPSTVRRLSAALDVEPAWLLFGDEGKAAA